MDILDELKMVTATLGRRRHRLCPLCGGVAMAVYDLPRATLDIDLLIQIDSLLIAKRAVEPLGFTMSGAPMEFHGGTIQIYRLCKIEPGTGKELMLDFLMVTPGTASAWEDRRKVEWEGGTLKVVSPQRTDPTQIVPSKRKGSR